jgi:hypothetical protein
LQPALAAGLVAIVSIIASELESFFRDEGSQSGEGVQGGRTVPVRAGLSRNNERCEDHK